ncbi:MAG: hydroxymethylglutaryl-CoA synthase family protein [Spirochaetales bacterium]|nr:hydroxymethylglutaryl-CoA synthase family protein [Spirochaetales bacterium]
MRVGIEKINFYPGAAFVDVKEIFKARDLELGRFENLMMTNKSVGLPCEDPVTNGVNAAKPIVDLLSDEDKESIEMIITASESGLDFGKSLSTYIHQYIGITRKCRLFEVKQACYGGTAALQMAANFVASGVSPGAKVLIIATDSARVALKSTYAEPSQATGAMAALVSDKPDILDLDYGANGYYSYEVMDSFRPLAELELGDPDLSLLSYLDCLDACFAEYSKKVEEIDFGTTFDFLAFHTPFAGMVKGAHRKMMRHNCKARGEIIDQDFRKRLAQSLIYCSEVGNTYSASLYLALISLIDNAQLMDFNRVGLFSYGSGCSSEFFSGIITPRSKECVQKMKIREGIHKRYCLSMEEYDAVLELNRECNIGTRDLQVDIHQFGKIYNHFFKDKGYLVLNKIKDFHREYVFS